MERIRQKKRVGSLVLSVSLIAVGVVAAVQNPQTTVSGQGNSSQAGPRLQSDRAPQTGSPIHSLTSIPHAPDSINLMQQTDEEALAKSSGCLTCHQGAHDPHYKETV